MTRLAALLLLVALGAPTGCVTSDRDAVNRARAEYEACAAEHSADARECEGLKATLLKAQQRYEENARRAWGCDPASPECPRDRDG